MFEYCRLANRPLTVPNGKSLVAKELMVWSGREGYYHDDDEADDEEEPENDDRLTGCGEGGENGDDDEDHERMYVAFDGHAITMNDKDINHQPHYLRCMLTLLVAVAAGTGRTLILPTIFHDAFYFCK